MAATDKKMLISALAFGLISLPGVAQTGSSTPDSSTTPQATQTQQTPAQANTTDSYATGKPLEGTSKEGFWGHVNPFARKKWVNRQITPIKDRTNELDQLQAKNRNDIHDVDSRAQAGISKANDAAALADQHAQDASNRANSANTLASNASNRTDTLRGTVSNLDQYQQVSATTVNFVPGHTALGKTAKADLDDMAAKLGTEKGYIIEVTGYSRSGVASSQTLADSVVRYLVTEHQVPVYRIYKSGLGRQTAEQKSADGDVAIRNGVRVTLLHNSLANMNGTNAANTPPAQPASSTGVSNPPSNQ